jgi:hypothetical protein
VDGDNSDIHADSYYDDAATMLTLMMMMMLMLMLMMPMAPMFKKRNTTS